MKEKIKIDKLFQDKFQDFEVEPSEIVWDNLEAILQKKKKRRVLPFWWKLSGVAAVFLIGLGLFNPFNSSNNTISNKNNVVVNDSISNKTDELNSTKKNNEVLVNTEAKKANNSNLNASKNEAIAIEENNTNSKLNKNQNNSIGNNKNAVAIENTTTASETKKMVGKNTTNKLLNNNNAAIVTTNANKKIKKNLEIKSNATNSNNQIVDNKIKSNTEPIVQYSDKNKIQKSIDNVNNNNIINQEKNNSNKNEFVAETKNEKENLNSKDLKIKDTTSIASVVPNALEELLNEKEAKKIVEQKINRWQITTSVAPIYFSSLSNGSPLDSSFVSNSKDFKTSFSYGAGVNYAINKKIKIRTGINAVAYEYRTNDVVFYQNNNARSIEHVDTNLQGSLIQVESKKSPSSDLEINPNGLVANKFDSAINQKFGYIEIPVELSYKVLDKKFGIEFIGGMSTMFLNKNEIYLESDGLNMNIGEADNLNKMHLSSNLGIGFNYSFLKNFEAKLEPTFKYQFNAFTADSGNFRPYTIGIYSGISYTF